MHAAQKSQSAAGNSDASNVIKEILFTPTKAKQYRKRDTSTKDIIKKHTPSEALSIFMETDKTKK